MELRLAISEVSHCSGPLFTRTSFRECYTTRQLVVAISRQSISSLASNEASGLGSIDSRISFCFPASTSFSSCTHATHHFIQPLLSLCFSFSVSLQRYFSLSLDLPLWKPLSWETWEYSDHRTERSDRLSESAAWFSNYLPL